MSIRLIQLTRARQDLDSGISNVCWTVVVLSSLIIISCAGCSAPGESRSTSSSQQPGADGLSQRGSELYKTSAAKQMEDQRAAAARIKRLMEAQGLQRHKETGQSYYTSYTDIYDWEMYFDGLALAYYGGEEHTMGGLHVFLSRQREDGFISRHVLKQKPPAEEGEVARRLYHYESNELCKPFLCQAALIVSRMRGDASWLGVEDFGRLMRFINCWLTAWDRDGDGLSEWASAPQSGADTQLERIGPWESYYCEGVDINCYLYRELLAAAELAKALRLPKEVAYFKQQAARKKERIQALLWDEKDGCYYSRDRRTGELIRVKDAEMFLPLWAGVATPKQARLLVSRHLRNPAEFWTPYPVPSYARSEPHYTQYFKPGPGIPECFEVEAGHGNWSGSVYPHWNYLFVHGLEDYGFHKEARHIAQVYSEVMRRQPDFYEYYNAETGDGLGVHPFWAGATLLLNCLPAELDLHFNPEAIRRVSEKLDFHDIRQELGIDGSFHPTVH